MRHAVTRFTWRALAVLGATVAAAAGIVVTVVVMLRSPVPETGFGPFIAVIGVILLLLGLGSAPVWNGIGVMRLKRLRPDALVVLARREPSLAPDLPLYLRRKGLSVDVSDRWLPAVIDKRGIAAWSGGPRPRELLLMEWSEIGEVVATDYRSLDGQTRFGVAVDVRPFPTPLVVRVGHSSFGLQAAFDRAGTLAVAEAAGAKRPVGITPSR